jgi:hypothetical protein
MKQSEEPPFGSDLGEGKTEGGLVNCGGEEALSRLTLIRPNTSEREKTR